MGFVIPRPVVRRSIMLLVSVALWLGRRYFPDTAPKKEVCG